MLLLLLMMLLLTVVHSSVGSVVGRGVDGDSRTNEHGIDGLHDGGRQWAQWRFDGWLCLDMLVSVVVL